MAIFSKSPRMIMYIEFIIVINTLKFKTTWHFEVKDKFLNLEVKCQRQRKVSGYSRKQTRLSTKKKHYGKKGKRIAMSH